MTKKKIKEKIIFTPEMVTFKDSKKTPFQSWFPYLEGYSPNFVNIIIKKFMPKSNTILDPFAGTLTTGFAASELGINSLFCEINPVLQFIGNTKIEVRTLNFDLRKILAKTIEDISINLKDNLRKYGKDQHLEKTYYKIFNHDSNKPFIKKNLQEILISKSYIEDLKSKSFLISKLVTVASLISLVPSSLLKRAGDLRYKTPKELKKGIPSFADLVQNNLNVIKNDLLSFYPSLKNPPFLICENAFNLRKLPFLNIDGVITSPPYVNGTNYFRNTKLELWYLRFFRNPADLSNIRKNAVTAGINSVIGGKKESNNKKVQNIVEKLSQSPYDNRIPKMISNYFADIHDIFLSIKTHLNDGAMLAIDIGDSQFGGVYVPTDELLKSVMEDIGYNFIEDHYLRPRYSKNGKRLKQILLLFTVDKT